MAGWYEEAGAFGAQHGFVRTATGAITSFDISGAVSMAVRAINNSATVTGYYSDSNFHAYCFIRESDGDIASFDVLSSGSADCEGINDHGDITGDFVDGNTVHGFVRHANGSFDGQNGSQLIEPADINERGEVNWFLYRCERLAWLRASD